VLLSGVFNPFLLPSTRYKLHWYNVGVGVEEEDPANPLNIVRTIYKPGASLVNGLNQRKQNNEFVFLFSLVQSFHVVNQSCIQIAVITWNSYSTMLSITDRGPSCHIPHPAAATASQFDGATSAHVQATT